MTSKETLRDARFLRLFLEEKEERLTRMRSWATRVTASYGEAAGGRGDPERMARTVEEIVDYARELEEEVAELAAAQRAIGARVRGLSRPEHRLVLEMYYLNGRSWAEVAQRMHYSPRQVQTFHARALDEYGAAGKQGV